MGAHDDFADDLGESLGLRAVDLEVHTLPSAEPPASIDPLDPRASLATLVERSHQLEYGMRDFKATLNSILARVERLNTAGQTFAGNDSVLATKVREQGASIRKLDVQMASLLLWKSFLSGKGAMIAMIVGFGGTAAAAIAWMVGHVHFS